MFHSLVGTLRGMMDRGADSVEGAKLLWLCRDRCSGRVREDWMASDHRWVSEVSGWLEVDVFSRDLSEEFDLDVEQEDF